MSTKAWENHGGAGECERVGGFNPNGPCSRDVRQRPLSVLINRSTLSGIGMHPVMSQEVVSVEAMMDG